MASLRLAGVAPFPACALLFLILLTLASVDSRHSGSQGQFRGAAEASVPASFNSAEENEPVSIDGGSIAIKLRTRTIRSSSLTGVARHTPRLPSLERCGCNVIGLTSLEMVQNSLTCLTRPIRYSSSAGASSSSIHVYAEALGSSGLGIMLYILYPDSSIRSSQMRQEKHGDEDTLSIWSILGNCGVHVSDITVHECCRPEDLISEPLMEEHLSGRLSSNSTSSMSQIYAHLVPQAGLRGASIKMLSKLSRQCIWNLPDVQGNVAALSRHNIFKGNSNLPVACNILSVASIPGILFVDESSDVVKHNVHASRWLQGSWSPNMLLSELWESTIAEVSSSAVLHVAGIRGEGEVVGMADSGIDVHHCVFADGNSRDVPYLTLSNSSIQGHGSATVADTGHSKIRAYMSLPGIGDTSDYTSGHGTHIAASVVGSTNDPDMRESIDGVAPRARLAFFDIEVNAGGQEGRLRIPSDLQSGILEPIYAHGAHIQTHSWGSSGNGYTANARSVDKFMYENDDALVLWSAGNDGESGFGTVGTPATCKNCISVGTVLNGFSSFERRGNGEGVVYSRSSAATAPFAWGPTAVSSVSSRGPTSDGRLKPDLVAPGEIIASARGRTAGSAGGRCCDRAGCGQNTFCPADCSNQGRCVFQAAKSLQVCQCNSGRCGTDCSIVISGQVSVQDACCPNGCSSNGVCETVSSTSGSGSYQRCKCNDGFEGNDCSVVALKNLAVEYKRGTSMSAPILAAAAALLRQSLRNGILPSGFENPSDVMQSPSGSLLKALLAASAIPADAGVVTISSASGNATIAGTVDDTTHLGPVLDTSFSSGESLRRVSGLGLPVLSNVVPVPSSDPAQSRFAGLLASTRPRVFFREILVNTGFSKSFCFFVPPRPVFPFSAVIAWTDPPASLSVQSALVNDVRLVGSVNGVQLPFPAGTGIDNLLRVYLKSSDTSIWSETNFTEVSIAVTGQAVPQGPQKVSLAVSGDYWECGHQPSAQIAEADNYISVVLDGNLEGWDPAMVAGWLAAGMQLPSQEVTVIGAFQGVSQSMVSVRVQPSHFNTASSKLSNYVGQRPPGMQSVVVHIDEKFRGVQSGTQGYSVLLVRCIAFCFMLQMVSYHLPIYI